MKVFREHQIRVFEALSEQFLNLCKYLDCEHATNTTSIQCEDALGQRRSVFGICMRIHKVIELRSGFLAEQWRIHKRRFPNALGIPAHCIFQTAFLFERAPATVCGERRV